MARFEPLADARGDDDLRRRVVLDAVEVLRWREIAWRSSMRP